MQLELVHLCVVLIFLIQMSAFLSAFAYLFLLKMFTIYIYASALVHVSSIVFVPAYFLLLLPNILITLLQYNPPPPPPPPTKKEKSDELY